MHDVRFEWVLTLCSLIVKIIKLCFFPVHSKLVIHPGSHFSFNNFGIIKYFVSFFCSDVILAYKPFDELKVLNYKFKCYNQQLLAFRFLANEPE